MVQIGAPSGYDVANPHRTDPTKPTPTGFAAKDNDNFSVGLFDAFPEAIDVSAPMANFEALNGFIWFAKVLTNHQLGLLIHHSQAKEGLATLVVRGKCF